MRYVIMITSKCRCVRDVVMGVRGGYEWVSREGRLEESEVEVFGLREGGGKVLGGEIGEEVQAGGWERW
jgi:hypothetical protein